MKTVPAEKGSVISALPFFTYRGSGNDPEGVLLTLGWMDHKAFIGRMYLQRSTDKYEYRRSDQKKKKCKNF